MIDLEPQVYGTHSLRRTKVSLVYRKAGNLRACELLPQSQETGDYGRFLGIEVDDALEMSEQIDLGRGPGLKKADPATFAMGRERSLGQGAPSGSIPGRRPMSAPSAFPPSVSCRIRQPSSPVLRGPMDYRLLI